MFHDSKMTADEATRQKFVSDIAVKYDRDESVSVSACNIASNSISAQKSRIFYRFDSGWSWSDLRKKEHRKVEKTFFNCLLIFSVLIVKIRSQWKSFISFRWIFIDNVRTFTIEIYSFVCFFQNNWLRRNFPREKIFTYCYAAFPLAVRKTFAILLVQR